MLNELLSLRQENSKTFDLGENRRQLLVSIGAVHYKDNYTDPVELWKDIDLTWEGDRITKAPYELTRDGNKFTFKDKKTGEISTIERTSVFPPGIGFEVVPEFSAVRFRHTLPSDKIPFEASFKVTGKGLITTKAFDDEGELELETSLVAGILTEKLSQVKDKQTGKVRPAKGQIRIDPTWQVGASSDDFLRWNEGSFTTASTFFQAGFANPFVGSGARFLNITIPAGSTITLANLKVTGKARDLTVVNTRLRAQANINPATFSTNADYLTRTWTTAYVYWDAIPAWTADVEYTSPDIKTCIQEVIELANWASGNPMAILWEDYEGRSSVDNSLIHRAGYSYDGSTTYAPKLVVTYTTSIDTTVTPTTLALALTAYAPSIGMGTVVTPGTLALTLTSYAPSIVGGTVVTPSTLALTLTTYAPTITSDTVVTPSTLALGITGYAPTLHFKIPIINKVEIAWSNNPFDATPTWVDVSADLVNYNIKRGRQYEIDLFEAGTATITLLNHHGNYWMDNGVSIYAPNVKIGKRVRLSAFYNGIWYSRYVGYIESYTPVFGMAGLREPRMQLQCGDALSLIARYVLNSAGYSQELSGTRITNVLNSVGFPAADRSIDAGDYYVQATGALVNANALDHIKNVCTTEIGLFYIDRSGIATFESNSHRVKSPHYTSQGTFSTNYPDIEISLDDHLLFNQVRATRTGGTEQVANNSTSQTAYRIHALVRSGLLHINDADTLGYAQFLVYRYALPKTRAVSISLLPTALPSTLFPYCLGFDFSTRITVTAPSPSGITASGFFIENIEENYDATQPELWHFRWLLTNAYQGQFWILGVAGFTELGVTTRLF